jgi:hypothetical protein
MFISFFLALLLAPPPDLPPLVSRPAWKPDATLPRRDFNWERLLENREIRLLADNQLTLYFESKPGIARVQYYPRRRPVRLVGKLDYSVLERETQYRAEGVGILFVDGAGKSVRLQESDYRWWPHKMERKWRGADWEILEEVTLLGNVAGLRLTKLHGPALHAEVMDAAAPLDLVRMRQPSGSRFALDAPLTLFVAIGYEPAKVSAELAACQTNPAALFAKARGTWDYYFTAMVPRLEAADERLVRLYYYQFYVVRSSVYDIPYEPYVYPYTCPWKTGAIWQWSWNTPMNAVAERWLNDSSISKAGMMLIAANQGALYFGTYLRPHKLGYKNREILDWYPEMDRLQKRVEERDQEQEWLSVMPYTVPNSFLGTWEVYLMTGDREFLRANMPYMAGYEESARKRTKAGTLLTPFQIMVDEYDYSLRWKPVQSGFTKGGLQRGFDVPVLMVDFNVYLVELRRILSKAYRELGQSGKARDMERYAEQSAADVNRYLWNEQRAFYADARSDNGASTGVRAISGFTPLFAGIAPAARKKALMAALDDPKGFGSPYPIPSIELSHPDLDPNMATYGGDSLLTSGVWMMVNALARNGEAARAKDYFHKAVEMVAHDGVSSSYSYNSINAHANQARHTLATQSAVLIDLLGRYVAGITPRTDDLFEFNPLALDPARGPLKFGPFRYKQKHWIAAEWTGTEYVVTVDGASMRLPQPRHVIVEVENGKLKITGGDR